jgi:poly(hydroxyalkanoate) depolymerase family esterase
MKTLGATIADIRRQTRDVQALASAGLTVSIPRRPDALEELADFGSNPGNLRAWISVPAELRPGAALIVALHGCDQCADDYEKGSGWTSLASEANAVVLFPEQQPFNNRRMCFNWFAPRDVASTGGEAASIRQMILCLIDRLGLARDRIFVTGLSAGGAMAAALLALYPELFNAGAIIAGLPSGAATNAIEAFQAMAEGPTHVASLAAKPGSAGAQAWPRVMIWQGAEDKVVNPQNGEMLVEQWVAAHGLSMADFEASGRSRRIWRDAAGRAVVKHIVVEGLGHGTPIDSRSGALPSAYMIDVGLDSSRSIAQFWGLRPRVFSAPRRTVPLAGRSLQDCATEWTRRSMAWAGRLFSRDDGRTSFDF